MSLVIEGVNPLNRDLGLDDGVPIARHYMNEFIDSVGSSIGGRVLEFGCPTYAKQFACEYDLIDIDAANQAAKLHLDIAKPLPFSVEREQYDVVICTAVMQVVDDPQQSVDNLRTLLKPGGVLLLAEKCLTKIDPWAPAADKWRFTARALEHLLHAFSKVEVRSYGNVYSTCAYLMGLTAAAIDRDKLNYNDPDYQVVVAAHARK